MMSFLNTMRVLPVTIFMAFFLLTLKVGAIWEGFGQLSSGTLPVSSAQAEQQGEIDGPKSVEQILQERGTGGGATPQRPAPFEVAQATPNEAANAGEETAASSRDTFDDPTFYTQAEVDLLQKLAERREEIEARAKELDVRENLLKAAETRIDKKVESLQTLQKTIEDSLVQYEKEQEEKLVNLIKIYENMKPKDAGRIFEELEMNVLLEVAEKMNTRRLAPILAKMDPKKARDVTEELFRLRSLPNPGEVSVVQ